VAWIEFLIFFAILFVEFVKEDVPKEKVYCMSESASRSSHFTLASDHSLLVTFGDEISYDYHLAVRRFTHLLQTHAQRVVLNIHPAYASVMVTYDPRKISPTELEQFVRGLVQNIDSVAVEETRTVKIPVCYGDEFGPDLEHVATYHNLSIDEVIQIHVAGDYLVYFLGFSPGFPYLGGMSPKIATPRMTTPRIKVPAGSVAIGGSQTGVYSVSSPGGWHIIGRTPLQLFRADRNPPTLLQMGDVVQFIPITREGFGKLVPA
jgi:inhibitor of KinA